MKKFRLTIRKKTILMIVSFSLILILVSMLICGNMIIDNNEAHFKEIATYLSDTTAATVDTDLFQAVKADVKAIYDNAENKVMSDKWGSDEWLAYSSLFDGVKTTPEYNELLDFLRRIQGDNNAISCVYLSYVDIENEQFVYVVDAAYEDACPPGCLDYIYDVNKEVLTNPSRGFPAYVTDTDEYGWLVSVGIPIFSDTDEVLGYAFTDISMTEIKSAQWNDIYMMFFYLIIAMLIICIAGILIVNYRLIKPLKTLTDAASHYEQTEGGKRNIFSKLRINVNDEVGDLAASMKKMEQDINRQIEEISHVNSSLAASRKKAGRMELLANTDALTGVGSKTAYESRVADINAGISRGDDLSFAVVVVDLNNLKGLNDTYGHSTGDSVIINLSQFVSGIFGNSQVYRYGGDEFVLIPEGDDFENISALTAHFCLHMDKMKAIKLKPEDRIFAAIGYSVYEKGKDTCVGDVFTRADEAMYTQKSRMKNKD